MSVELETIEDSIIALHKATMTYLATVESYSGQLDDEQFNFIRKMPAIWVAFAGAGKPKQTGADRFLVPITFALMHCVRSVRGEKDARRGANDQDVGVYRMLADSQKLLTMNDLGLAIDHFRPGAVKTIYNTRLQNDGLVVFSQEWETKVVFNVAGLPMIGGAPVAPVTVAGKEVLSPIVDGKPVTTAVPTLGGVGIDYTVKTDGDDVTAHDELTLNT